MLSNLREDWKQVTEAIIALERVAVAEGRRATGAVPRLQRKTKRRAVVVPIRPHGSSAR
jgi:hypothetical protein